MITEKRICDQAFLVFTTVLLVILYLKVATHEGLALDGSAGILHLANTEDIKFLRGREFEEFVNQIGAVLLLKSNLVVSMQLLSYVLGISVFGIPTAIWIYSLRLSLNESFKFTLIFFAVIVQILFSSSFFLPSMLSNAVGLLIIVLASSSRELTRTQIALFISLSILSVRLYETMLAFSLIALVVLFLQSRNGRNIMSNSARNVIVSILLCSVLSSASGLIAPVSSENLESGLNVGAIFSILRLASSL